MGDHVGVPLAHRREKLVTRPDGALPRSGDRRARASSAASALARSPSAYTSATRTSGEKAMSRIAAATWDAASSGCPRQSASSARLAWTGMTNWMSAARSASGARS